MDYDVKVAAEKIRRWQKNSGLQGKEVAKAIGISAPYYSDIRKGKQRGSIGVSECVKCFETVIRKN